MATMDELVEGCADRLYKAIHHDGMTREKVAMITEGYDARRTYLRDALQYVGYQVENLAWGQKGETDDRDFTEDEKEAFVVRVAERLGCRDARKLRRLLKEGSNNQLHTISNDMADFFREVHRNQTNDQSQDRSTRQQQQTSQSNQGQGYRSTQDGRRY